MPSTTKVLRSTPRYFFPYRLFSWITSYSLQTFRSGSLSSSNGNAIFFLNFSCEATESGEMPRISALAFLN